MFAATHQQRFDRAIYLTYVGLHEENIFKSTTKENFFAKLYSDKLQKRESIEFDKTRIYRLADEKEIWLGKYVRVLGHVWKEEGVESYWIKK